VIPELDGRFLHNSLTNHETVNGTLLGSTTATRLYKVHPYHIETDEITINSGGGPDKAYGVLAILNTMGDPSITT